MIFTDQTGTRIELHDTPKRIVSIVPSQTELLYHLGVAPIAQTIFCIKPESAFKTAIKIGGTKKLQLDKIRELQPDLILGNVEENSKDQILALREEFPVWISDIYDLNDALSMIRSFGEILNRPDESGSLLDRIHRSREQLLSIPGSPKKVLYLIWREPYMAAGKNTFINSMIEFMGWENAIQEKDSRYPEVDRDTIVRLNPDLILLSSEPFPFKEEHAEELCSRISGPEIVLVDGESFSWYGSRIPHAMDYLSNLKLKFNLP